MNDLNIFFFVHTLTDLEHLAVCIKLKVLT
jgi:hypothetical protein